MDFYGSEHTQIGGECPAHDILENVSTDPLITRETGPTEASASSQSRGENAFIANETSIVNDTAIEGTMNPISSEIRNILEKWMEHLKTHNLQDATIFMPCYCAADAPPPQRFVRRGGNKSRKLS